MKSFADAKARIQGRGLRIVLPEGNDERILAAYRRLRGENLADPLLLATDLGPATQAQIAEAQDGSLQQPGGVFIPRTNLNEHQAKALLDVGGRLVAEELRPFQTAMNQLGATLLSLPREHATRARAR